MTEKHELVGLTKNRIEALTDGVFAIAMTLIVFSIKVPDLPEHPSAGDIVYGVNFILVGMTLYVHFWYAVGPGHLLDKEMEPRYRVAQKLILSGPVASTICIVIAFWHPLIASTLFVLIPIFYIVPRSIDRQFAAVLRSIQGDS
jgi:uncharacterized membrane protein